MDAILQLAERLGKAIAESTQAQAMRQARKALADQPGAAELLKTYQEHASKIARLEAEQKPVEVDDKHKLQELHDQLIATESFKKLTAAQVEYVDVMRKVNDAIRRQLADTD